MQAAPHGYERLSGVLISGILGVRLLAHTRAATLQNLVKIDDTLFEGTRWSERCDLELQHDAYTTPMVSGRPPSPPNTRKRILATALPVRIPMHHHRYLLSRASICP